MTEPEADDADRQEQATPVAAGGPQLAGEVTPPGDAVPRADAIEQQLTATSRGTSAVHPGTAEADEYDVLEQQTDVPDDEDDLRG
ncbi:MAG: uncharacterized protein JWR62_76 [Modestobacter sp.]|jgi:hypothetical protein|nr:uncharacterized protein [Modestobacter sp.]